MAGYKVIALDTRKPTSQRFLTLQEAALDSFICRLQGTPCKVVEFPSSKTVCYIPRRVK